jgi:hypothetical protein
LAALVGPAQNIFFLAVHYLNSFFSIVQQAWQAAVLGRRLLECVSDSNPQKTTKPTRNSNQK